MKRLQGWACVLAAAALLGCEPSAPAPSPSFQVDEMPSPAREGSGQPHLAAGPDGPVLSWLEESGDGGHTLFMDRLGPDGWTGRRAVRSSERFFVNWADVPSVVPLDDGSVAAHWLLRGAQGGYDYGVRVSFSRDGGASWSEPWTPHDDRSPTEHGFVSILPLAGGGAGFVWLDGRKFAEVPSTGGGPAGHGSEAAEMTLRFRTGGAEIEPGPEVLLDERTCECCQTAMVSTARGPLVFYRDRSPEEVRDIYVTRRVEGRWTEPTPVHRDGWVFAACPVNGPAAAAAERRVAVAWFTGARDTARVRLAFSRDAGASFDEPVRVDDGNPAGRVDVALLADGSAAVTWLERVGGASELRLRRIGPDGEVGPGVTVGRSTDGRSSGFPRLVATGEGTLLVAWTDARGDRSTVRVARIRPTGPAAEELATRGGEG